jgi:tuftelin-interacting protein 11
MSKKDEEIEEMDYGQGRASFGGNLYQEFVSNTQPKEPQKQTRFDNTFEPEPMQAPDRDFAKFEKYTKGIGSKLLMKMGYKPGQGLGAGGKGINAPIDVKLRPAKMGIGHGGFDERTDAVKKELQVHEETPKLNYRWKQTNKKRVRTYKTAQQLIKEQEEQAVPVTATPTITKIRDLTGKDERIITDMSELSVENVLSKSERLPELRFNVSMIAQLSQTDLLHISRQMRMENSHKERLKKEVSENKSLVEKETKKLNRAFEIQKIVYECNKSAFEQSQILSSPDIHPSIIKHLFGQNFDLLFKEYYVEFKEYHLDMFVISLISPILKHLLSNWDPLSDPEYCVDILSELTAMFPKENTHMSCFEAMLFTIWLPKVRQEIR